MSQKIVGGARAFFVTSPYSPGPDGVLEPAIPEVCPFRLRGDPPCDVRRHWHRARKTGPTFDLSIVRCHTHGHAFTLYPPGFAPYQRTPLVALAPDGSQPIADPPSRDPLAAFEGTLFDAALDGERRRAWARSSQGGAPDRWWSTQGRHLQTAAKLLGVAPETDARLRERIAGALSVDHLFLRDRARTDASGYHARSKLVCAVLRRLWRVTRLALRLLYCGRLIGRWGLPCIWDPARRDFDRLPFRLPPIRAPA
ncbi:MAG: hypothetical protein JXA90_16800 [Planctomycetes bacterium]|nr:hypothetical protein [Planctomycetota bacterium]